MRKVLIALLILFAVVVGIAAVCAAATGRTDGFGVVMPVQVAHADGLIPDTAKFSPDDWDLDNCTQAEELALGTNPKDPFDNMNATRDGLNRVDDILMVVGAYFDDDPVGEVDYSSQTDRTGVPGGGLGPPNGQQRVDDILAQVRQYFHDCNDTEWCGGNVFNASEEPTEGVTFSEGKTYTLNCVRNDTGVGSDYSIETGEHDLTYVGQVEGDLPEMMTGDFSSAKTIPAIEGTIAGNWCRSTSCPMSVHHFEFDQKKDWTACFIVCVMQQHLVIHAEHYGVFGGPWSGVVSAPFSLWTDADSNWPWSVGSVEDPPSWDWINFGLKFRVLGSAVYNAESAAGTLRSETKNCKYSAGPWNDVTDRRCW